MQTKSYVESFLFAVIALFNKKFGIKLHSFLL